MPAILRRIKEREEAMEKVKKARAKHIGFSGQREFCRNNDHTYTEKFGGEQVLMCNYPFPDIHHKKGVCRANTCTDMREIPQEITDADEALAVKDFSTTIGASEEKVCEVEAGSKGIEYEDGDQDEETKPQLVPVPSLEPEYMPDVKVE
jgi:hypothetical protein